MKNTMFLVDVTFIFFFILSTHLGRIDARTHKKKHDKSSPPPSSSGLPVDDSSSKIFNVMNYGAKGDGTTDNSHAFLSAWTDACENPGNSMILVPSSGVYLVGHVTFTGDCKSRMVFQLEGKIIAPSLGDWKEDSSVLSWLEFTKITNGLTINGDGANAIIDGQGEAWWDDNRDHKPTAVRVADTKGVIVSGITIQNSQQTHLKFDNCDGVEAYGITISSPGDSANTDGIHTQGSQNVLIHDNTIACGDDCISIQTGSSAININNVKCGPSHGISLGGLGKDGTKACVSKVTVKDCSITDSDSGVRIKTWQGGSGSVQQVSFSNIQVSEVKNPIVIDQFYCGGSDNCPHKSGAVAISDVTYSNIHGSFSAYSTSLHCSPDVPCKGITLSDISLSPSQEAQLSPFCENAYGSVDDTNHCLKKGGTSSSSSSSYKYSNSDGDDYTC